MAELRSAEGLAPQRTVTTYQGVMVLVGGVLQVNVNGNVLPARWADPLVVVEGDPVLVELSGSRAGQAAAFVRCRLTDKPRPGQGTVKTVPASSPTITVTGSDGLVYTATFVASYSPVVGDPVILSWNAAVPSVVGKVTTTAAPTPVAPPVAPPPGAGMTGSTPYQAATADTYYPAGGWGKWAGGGGRVYQGSYGAGQVYGAWFYAGSTAQQAGKTITGIRFTLGARLPVGNNNQPVTVHVYAHTSANKPGDDVNRVAGPFDITVQPGQGLTEYALPLSFASALQGGGGIAIAGDPYAGFNGPSTQPESGLLILDWSA
ncbi:hypothetical protein [Arthrobacter sp. B3I4]|uniref:hypothetical protein n=1 Tax=Arthrobacter sp. B3I4 TaxID=3042267 RepID=UPI00278B8088|nr:hypothetical protein [Arthrobacter sp. B3I4]MDQ0756065.1 hypothetical protein [Arthrobacter sp. B3I4]